LLEKASTAVAGALAYAGVGGLARGLAGARHGNGYAPPSYPNVSPYPGFAGPRPMAPMAVGAGGLLGGLGTVLGAAAMGKAVLNPVSIAIDEVDEVAENRKITRTFLVH